MEGLEKINEYEVMSKLGEGGWAEVFLVTSKAGAELALKLYFKDNKIEDVKSFYNKACLFNHKNVLSPISFGEYDSRGYITFRLCDKSLMQEISERNKNIDSFTDLELAKVINDVAQGLMYINEKGYVHNDLKPDNILQLEIDDTTQYLISDFDVINEFHSGSYAFKPKQKKTAGLARAYAAPELLENKASFKSDVFSLGIAIYEMATGDLPFKETNVGLGEALQKGMSLDYHKLESSLNHTPKRFRDLLIACINIDEDKRPSAKELFELSSRKLNTNSWPAFKPTTDVGKPAPEVIDTALVGDITSTTSNIKSIVPSLKKLAVIALAIFCSLFGFEKYKLNDAENLLSAGQVTEAVTGFKSGPYLINSSRAKRNAAIAQNLTDSYESVSTFINGRAIGKNKSTRRYDLINTDGSIVAKDQDYIYRNINGATVLIAQSDTDCAAIQVLNNRNQRKEFKANRIFGFLTKGSELNIENCNKKIEKIKI